MQISSYLSILLNKVPREESYASHCLAIKESGLQECCIMCAVTLVILLISQPQVARLCWVKQSSFGLILSLVSCIFFRGIMLCDAEFVSSSAVFLQACFCLLPSVVLFTSPSLCYEILNFVFPFEHFIDFFVCLFLLWSLILFLVSVN